MTTLDDLEIGHRRFNHRNLSYDYTFKEIQRPLLENVTIRRLHKYLELVQQGKFPNELFENPAVPRASMMKIHGLDKSQKQYLQQYLFDQGIVKRSASTEISQLVQAVFRSFKEMEFQKKPDHAPVLKSILLKDPRSVAIELPVWKVNQEKSHCLTGHIDLVQVEKHEKFEIKILDYKPEGENRFIFCLPQVALYAKMMQAKLAPEECEINCYIFDKKAMWQFKDDVLEKLDDKLVRYSVPRAWSIFLN
ncbi:MAG TPA: hypothetical protein VKM55_05325 [Candidatus Lokiarchaeia archaeon]|nr:hypothetical protein [Candidatus Lokiarchaeia archaeon]